MTQKWNLQDIRPAEPRKPQRPTLPPTVIRDVSSPETRHISGNGTTPHKQHKMERDLEPHTYHERPETEPDDLQIDAGDRISVVDGRKRGRNHILIATIGFLVLIGLGLFFSYLTSGATITVYPKQRQMNVNAEFTAFKEQRAGELTYEILTIEASGERQVAASGQETVTSQATGNLEISKSTPGAERLIKNTRFAADDGKVYRIEESVVVPGAVKDSSGALVPGRIQAKVFADEAGDGYNLGAGAKFMVPGFKEGGFTDLYNAISATNPEAFVGGFNGPKYIINDQELATARQSLQMELRDSLLSRTKSERPSGFTTFEGAVAITYNQLPPVPYGDNLVTIKEQAVLQMPLFKADDFASFLAQESIVGYEGEGVRIQNVDTLTFSYSNPTTSQSVLANNDSLTFKIVGEPHIVWTFDEGKLKVELTDVAKTAIPQIMTGYPGISKSVVDVRPIWMRTMPEDMDDIKVIESLEEKGQ